jgi:hypothetical protein
MDKNVQIIFIPGIMGSTLKNRNMPIWPWTDYLFDSYELLTDINNPNIYSNKVEPITYRLLLKKLKEVTPNVIPFHYDWRQNNLKHLDDLKNKIDENADEIIFVAHSMGGIIAKLFFNKFREEAFIHKISKFITLGTPWNGAMDAYRTLKYGKSIPDKITKIKGCILNKKTSKKISPYFPSVYQLLPNRNYCQSALKTETKTLVPYRKNNKNYYDIDEFFLDNLKKDFESYQHVYTEIFEDFFNLLQEEIPEHIKHFEIIGVGKPTIASIIENSLGEAEGDFRNGDGTVPLFSALSNEGNAFFVNKVEHQDLPKNEEVLKLITDILNDVTEFTENSTIFKSLQSQYNKGFSGKILKIACPVEISLVNKEGQVIYGAIETIDDEGLKEILTQEYNVEELGETTYVIFDDDDNEIDNLDKVLIHAYDKGPTTVSIDEYVNGENTKRKAFKMFEINPDIEAELSLSPKIEENTLSIREIGKEPIPIKSSMEDLINDIVYPTTEIEILAENLIRPDDNKDTFLVKGAVLLKISDVKKGSYEIDSTFVRINGNLIRVEPGEYIELNLTEGYNELEYFTKDIFGNLETSNKIKIFLLPKFSFNLKIEFLPHQYTVDLEFNELYKEVAQIYNFDIKEINWSFDNNEKQFGNDVFYIYKNRNLKINYVNFFGEEEQFDIDIDENIIASIFEGTAQAQNLEDFIYINLKLTKPKIHFIMPEGESQRGYFRKISNENISKCTDIIIEEVPLEIKISKNKKYKISFQNLSEDIVLDNNPIYSLNFKVFDNERNKDIRTLNLQFFNKIKGLDDVIFTDNKDVLFNQQKDVYTAIIDLEEVKNKIQKYWTNKAIPLLEVNIIDKISGNILRSQEIYIRV